MGINNFFADYFKLSFESALLIPIPFDKWNINKNINNIENLNSQYFMAVTLNSALYGYLNINKYLNFFCGIGIEVLYSNGQSIFKEEKNLLYGYLGDNYVFFAYILKLE